MGMVAAPLAMPQVAWELFGIDPASEEFVTRYGEQIRRIVAHLARRPRLADAVAHREIAAEEFLGFLPGPGGRLGWWNIGAIRLWNACPASSSTCICTFGYRAAASSTARTRSRGMYGSLPPKWNCTGALIWLSRSRLSGTAEP